MTLNVIFTSAKDELAALARIQRAANRLDVRVGVFRHGWKTDLTFHGEDAVAAATAARSIIVGWEAGKIMELREVPA